MESVRKPSKRKASLDARSAILAQSIQTKRPNNVKINSKNAVKTRQITRTKPVGPGKSYAVADEPVNSAVNLDCPAKSLRKRRKSDPKVQTSSHSSDLELLNSHFSTPLSNPADVIVCTCYKPPSCPLHVGSSPFITLPCGTNFTTTDSNLPSQWSTTVDSVQIAGPTQMLGDAISLPAIFQGRLIIPNQFASSLGKVLANQMGSPTSCNPMTLLGMDDVPSEPIPTTNVSGNTTQSAAMQCLSVNVEPNPKSVENSLTPKSCSSNCSGVLALSTNWVPIGRPSKRYVYYNNDAKPIRRMCFDSIKHKTEPDYIRVRDCVVVNSQPDKPQNDPGLLSATSDKLGLYIGKVYEFFEHPKNKILYANVLWYYWPEQAPLEDPVPSTSQTHPKEIYSSRHFDIVPVDCIEDVVNVLTLNEYIRYVAENLQERLWPNRKEVIPRAVSGYWRRKLMPPEDQAESDVFFSRRVYDFHGKRFIKDPS